MKTLRSSLLRDGSSVPLSPFLSGTKIPTWSRCDAVLAGYSPCSLAFRSILYRSSRARRACCCSTFNSPTSVSKFKLATRCFWITTSCGSARPQHLQRTQWTPGLAGLSSLRASFLRHQAPITSLLRLSAAVTYVASNSLSFIANSKQHRSFAIPS